MAGHSKWANTKHRKAAQDAKRGKIFTKIIRELVTAVLSVADHWQQDLSQTPGLVELVTADLDAILTCGMRDAVKPLC